MARFNTHGLDAVIQQMKDLGELAGPTADKMLVAGAKEVKKSWKAAAKIHGLIDTGDMYESIDYPMKPTTINGIKTMDIYPQGKDRKGVRNALKAFVLHYGTSKMKATHWVDTADKLAEEPTIAAMKEIWDDELRKRGL